MSMYELFGNVIMTEQGDRVAVAGFAPEGQGAACAEALLSLQTVCFRSADPYDIDVTLIEALRGCLPEQVSVVGASVHVRDGIKPLCPTGGVIGELRESESSSEGMLELLDGGTVLFTRPGGPGFAAVCSKQIAEQAAATLPPEIRFRETKNGAQTLVSFFEQNGVDTYIVAADGSGVVSPGTVAARCGSDKLYFIV